MYLDWRQRAGNRRSAYGTELGKGTSGITLRQRLILGTVISVAVSAAVSVWSLPVVAIESGATPKVVYAAETAPIRVAATTAELSVVEEEVRTFFTDAPIMAEVAYCESRFRHTTASGELLRGTVNAADVGVMQINERYHARRAQELGLDLHSFEGNLEYARYLYEEQGTQPWIASKPCWSKRPVQNSTHLAARGN